MTRRIRRRCCPSRRRWRRTAPARRPVRSSPSEPPFGGRASSALGSGDEGLCPSPSPCCATRTRGDLLVLVDDRDFQRFTELDAVTVHCEGHAIQAALVVFDDE